MDKILELKQRKLDLVSAIEAILNKADEESRSLTDEETVQYTESDKKLGELNATIERYERLAAEQTSLNTIQRKAPAVIIPGKTHDEKEFRNIGEFIFSVITNRSDKRLDQFRVESRAQQVGDSTLGGYMVPPQFSQTILSVAPDQAVVRPRATITSTGDLQELSIPVLDQTSARNIYGGFSVYHTGDQTAVTEQNVYLRRVTLKPRKMPKCF